MSLRLAWSQDEMWKRTALQRGIARHGRRVLVLALALAGYLATVVGGGVVLTEQTMRLPRRAVTAAMEAEAHATAARLGARLTTETVLSVDSARLRAWWFVPSGTPHGTVLLLHGQAANRAATLNLAELLVGAGYRVLATDARAHGASEGDLATYGVLERDDVRMWAEWAGRQHPDECLFGAGASMGAAMLLQALPDVGFCAVVAESAYASFAGLARFRLADRWGLRGVVGRGAAAPVVLAGTTYARLRYGTDLASVQPAERVGAARVPVLVIHGTADTVVPVDHARAIARANPRYVTLWTIEGAPHVQAWATEPRVYPARVLGFLAAHR